MAQLDFFRIGRSAEDYRDSGGTPFAKVRPRITCADSFSISVQAGQYLYSVPREDPGPWSHVECGFPSERPEPWAEWSKYAEDPDKPARTVYAYVSLTLVEALVTAHGGEA